MGNTAVSWRVSREAVSPGHGKADMSKVESQKWATGMNLVLLIVDLQEFCIKENMKMC